MLHHGSFRDEFALCDGGWYNGCGVGEGFVERMVNQLYIRVVKGRS